MPATTMARMWYQPNGALSISASARRRRSFGSSMCAKSLTKLWKAALPPAVLAAMAERAMQCNRMGGYETAGAVVAEGEGTRARWQPDIWLEKGVACFGPH